MHEHATDGAPLVADGHISRSHDGAWTAVALAPRAIGIDLCLRSHAPRIAKILRWLAIECDADPIAQFAALEAALKLRRRSIEHLLARTVRISRDDRALVVHGTSWASATPAMHAAAIAPASNRSSEVAFPRGRVVIGFRYISGDAREQRLFVRIGNEGVAAFLKPERFAELQALVNSANRTILEVQDKRGHHR